MSELARSSQRPPSADHTSPSAGHGLHDVDRGTRPRAQPFGNQAALRSLGGFLVQPKLRVNAPGDSLEREADAAADAVTRAPEHGPVAAPAATLSRATPA